MLWRHILGYLPVNIVQGVVSVATIVLLTRLLDPEAYGRYALVLATVQLVSMAGFSWLHAGMARFFESARQAGRLPEHFSTGYLVCFAMAAAVSAVYAGAVLLIDLPDTIRMALLFGLAMLLLRVVLMMGLETHRAARHVAAFGLLETIQLLGGLALGLLLIMTTSLAESGPFLGAAIASAVCLAVDFPRILALSRWGRPQMAELRRFASYGIPISVTLALALVFASADRFLIAYMLDDAAVGIYAAGYQIASRVMDILFAWIGSATAPLVIAAYERDGVAAARSLLSRNFENIILVAFPAAAGLALVAEPLAAVMVGEQFRSAAAGIVPWIALSALMLGFVSYYVHHAFVLSRRTGIEAALMVVPAVANIALNLILIPRIGLQGAVVSTVVSYALALGLATIVGIRHFPLPLPGRAIVKGLIATAGMAVVVSLVPTVPSAACLVAKMIAGFVGYVPLALLLNIAGCRSWVHALAGRFVPRSSNG